MQEIDRSKFGGKCPNCGSSSLKSMGGHVGKTQYQCNECGLDFVVISKKKQIIVRPPR